MSYQFPPDVEARMTGGIYRSEDDLLREALDALDEREQLRLKQWQERNLIAAEQSRLGLSKPLDLERVLERVEKRVAENRAGQ